MSVSTKHSQARPVTGVVTHAADKTARERSKDHGGSQRAITVAQHHLQHGAYQEAVAVLKAAGHENRVRDLLGVSLMRAGETEHAVQVFRQLVLVPNTVYPRAEISDLCKRNYATALLLKGLPSGALEVLTFCNDRTAVRAQQIQAAIRQWEKSLSWFRRLDWKLNLIEPPHCRVPIDFEPGEVQTDAVRTRPASTSPGQPTLAA